MAIKSEIDSLSKIVGTSVESDRLNNFLWVHLHILKIPSGQLNFPPSDRIKSARVLSQNNFQLDEFKVKIKQGLIAKEHFEWIDRGNKRQIKWLLNYLYSFYYPGSNLHQSLSTHITGKDLIISLVDALYFSPEIIKNNLESLKNFWFSHLDKDKVFNWLKLKDEKSRCEFTFHWLKSNNHQFTQEMSKYQEFDDIMIIIDSINLSDNEKELIISKVKKSWSQANFRKNLLGKRQTNLILKESTINLLDKMSIKYDLSRAEIIDFLVRAEDSENSRYLEAREKRRLNFLED